MLVLASLIAFAGPGERCLAMTSPELRRQISTVPALESEVVLAPEGMTAGDARNLAAALHADLVPIGDRWRIFRRGATQDALREDDRAWVKAQIDATVSRIDNLAQKYVKSPIEAPYEAMRTARTRFEARSRDVLDTSGLQAEELTPAARLLVDLLRRMPADALRDLAPGTITVFSNVPARTERLLTVEGPTLSAYVEAQRKFAEWSEEAFAQGKIPDAYRWAFAHGIVRMGERTVQLGVDRRGPEPTFSLFVYDAAGHHEANVSLVARGVEDRDGPPALGSSKLGQTLLPTETRTAIARATLGSPSFRAESLDPVTHEPLDLCVRDALLLWTRAKGFARLVACVPDALVEGATECVDGTTLDLDRLTTAIDRAGCESRAEGRTLIVRPRHPLQEEALRIDRRPLSALCRAASRGGVGLDDLLAYHTAYADTYAHRRLLQELERPIAVAFSLSDSPGWSLPHPLLATLGRLSMSERGVLRAGGKVSLDTPAFSDGLFSLAQFAGGHRGAGAGSDLERTPTRLLACPGGRWLEGESVARTLVRRVARGYGERTTVDPTTGATNVEKVEHLVLDGSFVPLSMIAAELPQEGDYAQLDREFLFLWAEVRSTTFRAVFGEAAHAGPFALDERLRESKVPVPLGQVPGLSLPKTFP